MTFTAVVTADPDTGKRVSQKKIAAKVKRELETPLTDLPQTGGGGEYEDSFISKVTNIQVSELEE